MNLRPLRPNIVENKLSDRRSRGFRKRNKQQLLVGLATLHIINFMKTNSLAKTNTLIILIIR